MPFLLLGTAATAAIAAVGTTAAVPAVAATSGLFGTAGAFAIGQTLTTLSTAAIIGGTLSAAGAGRSQAKTAAAIAERNAAQLRVQASQEELVTKEEQKRLGEEKERRVSRLRVLAANAGIDIIGTPLLQLETIGGEFEEERRFIGQAGRQRRFGLEFRASQETSRATGIRRASRFRTGSTLLTGTSLLLRQTA